MPASIYTSLRSFPSSSLRLLSESHALCVTSHANSDTEMFDPQVNSIGLARTVNKSKRKGSMV